MAGNTQCPVISPKTNNVANADAFGVFRRRQPSKRLPVCCQSNLGGTHSRQNE